MFDEMGFLPATPHNKINIHVGGTYGDKDAALERFCKVGQWPERCRPQELYGLLLAASDSGWLANLAHVASCCLWCVVVLCAGCE